MDLYMYLVMNMTLGCVGFYALDVYVIVVACWVLFCYDGLDLYV